MVIHESRKYGFARALKHKVAEAREGRRPRRRSPGCILNDVAGFIGPEVFRTREQLVRCCLEDIVMGKLHGLPSASTSARRCTWTVASTTSTGASTRSCRRTRPT